MPVQTSKSNRTQVHSAASACSFKFYRGDMSRQCRLLYVPGVRMNCHGQLLRWVVVQVNEQRVGERVQRGVGRVIQRGVRPQDHRHAL